MKKSDFERFALAIAGLAEIFDPNRQGPTAVGMELYFKALEEYSIEDVESACMRLIKRRKFNSLPKPGEIEEEIKGTEDSAALLAWEKVDKAVKQHGPYASVKFDDPAIHGCIELMGGWTKFQNVSLEEWKWKRVEFEKLYPQMVKRGNHPEYLMGQIELNRQGTQYKSPPVIQIGGEEKLRLEEKNRERE